MQHVSFNSGIYIEREIWVDYIIMAYGSRGNISAVNDIFYCAQKSRKWHPVRPLILQQNVIICFYMV